MALGQKYVSAINDATQRFKRGERSSHVRLFSEVMEVYLTDRSVSILLLSSDKPLYNSLRRLLRLKAVPNSVTVIPGIVAGSKLLTFIPA